MNVFGKGARAGHFSLRIVAIAFAGACVSKTLGCDLCAIYSANQAQAESGKGFFGGIAEQFTHFGTVQVDGQRIANEANQYLDSSVSQLFVGYNFPHRLGLQFNLPVIERSFSRPDGLGGMDHGHESGIGDVSLLGNWVAYYHEEMNSTVMFNLLGGVKFPTGSSKRIAEELNEVENPVGPASGIHGHDLTLGSGAFDGIIGGTTYLRYRRLFLSTMVQYAIRGEGDLGYQFANDLTWSGGPGAYLVLREEYTLSLQALVSGEHKGRDTFQGEVAEDTGMTAVYIGPQVNFTWKEKLSVHLGADLPLSQDNTALQTVPDYRLHGGITWRF